MSGLLLTGVLIVYFVIQAQLLYPLTLACYAWATSSNPVYLADPTLSQYSSSYCAIALYIVLTFICSMKN